MCHLTPTPGLAAVPMGLEPLFLQARKWEKQNSSLTPSREPNWGWQRVPRVGPPPPTMMDTGQGAGAQAQQGSHRWGVLER